MSGGHVVGFRASGAGAPLAHILPYCSLHLIQVRAAPTSHAVRFTKTLRLPLLHSSQMRKRGSENNFPKHTRSGSGRSSSETVPHEETVVTETPYLRSHRDSAFCFPNNFPRGFVRTRGAVVEERVHGTTSSPSVPKSGFPGCLCGVAVPRIFRLLPLMMCHGLWGTHHALPSHSHSA